MKKIFVESTVFTPAENHAENVLTMFGLVLGCGLFDGRRDAVLALLDEVRAAVPLVGRRLELMSLDERASISRGHMIGSLIRPASLMRVLNRAAIETPQHEIWFDRLAFAIGNCSCENCAKGFESFRLYARALRRNSVQNSAAAKNN